MINRAILRGSMLCGLAAGIRSMTPPATASWELASGRLSLSPDSPLAFLEQLDVAGLIALMAAGEIVADKLPILPSRVAPLPLLGRMAAGGLTGAALASSGRGSTGVAVTISALAALFSAQTTYRLRASLIRLGVPSPVGGLLGDALAIILARAGVRQAEHTVA